MLSFPTTPRGTAGDVFERSQEGRRQIVGPLVEGQLVGQVERGCISALQSQCVALGCSDEGGHHVFVGAALILQRQC